MAMAYVVTCEGPDIPPIAAKGAADALYLALDLVDLGYADVRIRTPEGRIFTAKDFGQSLRGESLDEAQCAKRA